MCSSINQEHFLLIRCLHNYDLDHDHGHYHSYHGVGRSIGPYADSFPLSDHFQGGVGGLGLGGRSGGSQEGGGGASDPNTYGIK